MTTSPPSSPGDGAAPRQQVKAWAGVWGDLTMNRCPDCRKMAVAGSLLILAILSLAVFAMLKVASGAHG